jgi:hypothetical protein
MTPEQWTLAVGIAFKGFAAVGFLWIAKQICKVIVPRIPEGRLKRLLLFRWTN